MCLTSFLNMKKMYYILEYLKKNLIFFRVYKKNFVIYFLEYLTTTFIYEKYSKKYYINFCL